MIMNTHLLDDPEVTQNKVHKIWTEYHTSKQHTISSVLPTGKYEKFANRAKECPLFVLPIARGDGFLTLLLQHTQNTCMVTDLESYRKLQHLAEPFMYLTHYNELGAEKGVALMRGEIDLTKMSQVEGKMISSFMYAYYLQDDKYRLVNQFNHTPRDFNFDMLVGDLQTMKQKRDADDVEAEHWEWKEDELERRTKYDAMVKHGFKEQNSGATPWSPPVDEKGEVTDTTRAKLKDLWKM